MRKDATGRQCPAAAHVGSASNDCPDSREVLMPMSSPQQQQQPGLQTCKESEQISRCAEGAVQLHAETDSMQPREAEQVERAECADVTGELQRQDGAPEGVSFMDDVDCLDIE